ncbi:MAG TPA: hypothetical protein VGN38_13500 [Caulobacteraceae bacterium]|nr:hypothetical protein [Caulobacteraceae bacterium]
MERVGQVLAVVEGVGGRQAEHHLTIVVVVADIEHRMLGVDQRGQLGKHHVGDGAEVALALKHAGEAGEVGLQPILLGVLEGLILQIADHLVDVVLEFLDLAGRLDSDRPGEVALGDRSGHLGDGAHLGGEVRGQLVDVVGQVAPQAGGARHPGLAAELALDADLASDVGHLIGERGQGFDHAVDGVGQRRDLALGVQGQLALQIAVGHRGHHAGDVAHLSGKVGGHHVDVVGEVLPGAGHAGHLGLAAELAFGADFPGQASDFRGERIELIDHGVDGVLQLEDLAFHVDGDLARKVAVGDRGGHIGDVAHLTGEIAGHQIDVVGKLLPGPADPAHLRLTAELAFGADFAGDAGDLGGERIELIDHGVDGVFQLQDLAAHVDGDLLGEIAQGHRGGHLGDVAHLTGEIAGHQVHILSQLLPGPADAPHLGLAAELAFGADLARHAGDFRGERIELIDHGVDGVFQLQDLAAHIDGDLLGEIAQGHRGGHLGDIAHLPGEIAGHQVHIIGQFLPGAAHPAHLRLTAELALGADFARHAGDFGSEGVELIDHGVDGVLQLQDLAAHVDGDLLGEIAQGHRGGHLGDVAHLAGEVGGHVVDVVGEVLPGAGDTLDLGLAAELALGPDFARHPGDLGGERIELIDHGVDGVFQLQDLAFHIDGDLLGEITQGHRGGHLGDVAHLASQIAGHEIDVVGEVLPRAGDTFDSRLAAELAFGADLARHPGDLGGEGVQLIDHGVDGVLQLEDLALHIDGDLLGEIASGHGGRDLGDVAHLAGQIAGHEVHVVGQVLPCPGDTLDLSLAAELAFGADLARHPGHFGGERVELIDHGVDGVFQLLDFAFHVHRNLAREIAIGHRGGHLGDVAHLTGEVGGHEVDVIGEVFPGAGDALHLRLTAELALGADLAGDAGHLRGEGAQLADHGIDHLADAQELAAQRALFVLQVHGLGEVALGDTADHPRHFRGRVDHVGDQGVDRVDRRRPGPSRGRQSHPVIDLALASDHLAEALELLGHPVVEFDHFIEGLGDLAIGPGQPARQAHREIAAAEGAQGGQQRLIIEAGTSPRAPFFMAQCVGSLDRRAAGDDVRH